MANQRIGVVGNDQTDPALPELNVAVIPTAQGNALVTSAVFTGTLEVNLDLGNDEVAIGGPDSTDTRRLFRGRDDGGGRNVIETVPVLLGSQTLALGKAEDTAHVSGDAGVQALAVRRDVLISPGDDGDYVPLSTDQSGRLHTIPRQDQGSTVQQGVTAVGGSSTSIAGSNSQRRAITIQNRGPGPLYIRPDAAASTSSFLLANGESRTWDKSVTVEWFGISNGAGASAVVISEEN